MARKPTPAAPAVTPASMADMAAQGMSMAPSSEVGMMGHFAHLQQTVGTPAPIAEPMTPVAAQRRSR